MTDAFFAVDEEWRVTYANARARTFLAAAMDLDGADPVGRDLWAESPDAVETTFYERCNEAMETGEASTFDEYYEPRDTWFEVRAYPGANGLSVYFRDVTHSRQRQQDLQHRERVLRNLYDVTADPDRDFDEKVAALFDIGAAVLDMEFATLSRVVGDEYVFEYVRSPAGEVAAGDSIELVATSCERTASQRETLVISNLTDDAPDLAERAGNVELELSAYVGAPVLVDEEVYGTFCFYDREPREGFSDWEVTLVDLMTQWVSYELTRQRILERLERQNEQLEEFASIVSHDLRNPLTVLKGSMEMARETGGAEHFDRCTRAIERMEALVEDLLTLAKTGERVAEPTSVGLDEAVEECWATVATGEATLVVETDAAIRADPARLRQLLENLIRNAVEHGGEDVTVTVGSLDAGFFVADDGPGIPEDERGEVFEAGFTTSEDGTGFGLNIVKQVANAHGWTVAVAESESGGARFEFTGVEPG